ncbi:hypothetical protein BYT27DRAFT_7177307 [Phlegmacium glaucopus]|nr:hypothetical protein BYT27DRAFT_7177307 [Phlegmacium glaucopus]
MQKRKHNKSKSPTHRRETVDRSENSVSPASSPSDRRERKRVRWEGKSATEDPADIDSGDEIESSEKICLAALCSHGHVACAYYEPSKGLLYVMEDTQETLHYDLTRMLLEQVNPDIVLTSSKADDAFIDAVANHMDSTEGIFQIRPFKEFMASKGRDRLLSLSRFMDFSTEDSDLPPSSDIDSNSSRPANAYDFMRSRRETNGDPTIKRWNASIRLANFASVESSPLCMSSVGALLDYLVRERALSDFDDDGITGLDVRDIELLALDQAMQINGDALLSLQVFENESHASVHSDKTKEGLSLFGILNGTKTTMGRSLLRTWLLRPSLSISVIRFRQDAVACFLRSENLVTSNTMHNHLKGLKNVPRILGLMKDGRAKLSEWQGLVKFTYCVTMLRDAMSELHEGNHVDVLKRLLNALDITTFKEVGIRVNNIIDWEESSNHDRVCVRPHIDEDLDNGKHVYHGIDSSSVAEQISAIVPPDFAKSLNVVYFPQLGYLICVPMLEEWQNDTGIQGLDGWTFQFSSDAHVYFKSQEMHDMDTHIGDLHSTIVDKELEIVQELLEEVLKCDEAIRTACDVCAELDCLLSFAAASRQYDYRRPEMVQDNILKVIQGRHPLHEQVVDTFVPNDAHIIGGAGIGSSPTIPDDNNQWNSVLLCTGANACGKSVYLKQIALIQIMAQVIFVPAESATLGIVDKIFTRLSSRESVSKVQSTFMIDLSQVSLALRNCTPRSLVLLDEFGKGTLSTGSFALLSSVSTLSLVFYGAGLFCGVLRHLLNRGSACPKVLVATHFYEVFNEALLDPENIPVSFRHVQVMFTSSAGKVLEPSDFCVDASVSGASLDGDGHEDRDIIERKVGPGEKITYLYRVAEGLSLDSHAAKCAELFGVPTRMMKRAQYVTHVLSTHELGRLLDEGMSEAECLELEEAEVVCRRFLGWDLKAEAEREDGRVKMKLGQVLGRDSDQMGNEPT